MSSLYVDDVITGDDCENVVPADKQSSYAKQQIGEKEGKTQMLGLPWNKREDTNLSSDDDVDNDVELPVLSPTTMMYS